MHIKSVLTVCRFLLNDKGRHNNNALMQNKICFSTRYIFKISKRNHWQIKKYYNKNYIKC